MCHAKGLTFFAKATHFREGLLTNKNHIMHNVLIWIEFGDGNGTFLKTEANKNYKTNNGMAFDSNTLKLNLSPSCLNRAKIDALHPVVLSVDKCG